MYFKDYSIDKFLYELKTDLPSPGGGSTAALVSALAGALNSMVYSFTVDKKSFENLNHENKEKMKSLKVKCEEFISKSISYMETDRETFIALMDTFKLPKESDVEKKYRSQMIKEKTIAAMESPLCVCIRNLHCQLFLFPTTIPMPERQRQNICFKRGTAKSCW